MYKDYIHVMKKLQCLLKKNIHGSHLSLTSMFSTRSNFSLSFCICSNASIISLLHCSTLSTPQSILQPFCSLVLRTTLSIHIFLFGVTFNPKLSFQFPYWHTVVPVSFILPLHYILLTKPFTAEQFIAVTQASLNIHRWINHHICINHLKRTGIRYILALVLSSII